MGENLKEMYLSKKHGKTPSERIYKIYNILHKEHFGVTYKASNWVMFAKTVNTLISKVGSEYYLAMLLIIHFNWFGANGNDQNEHKYLENRFFSIYLVSKNISAYGAYSQNVLLLHHETNIVNFVDYHLKQI